jgi:RNA polymerase sigma factor (TIGR02999 family)
MADAAPGNVTQLLESARTGDPHAAERLLPIVYEELRKLAQQKMAQESPGHTLQATALVHEAYLRLVGDEDPGWENRAHFFGAAAEAMGRILGERARRYRRQKHGEGVKHFPVQESDLVVGPDSVDLVALDEALARLEQRDTRMGEVVKLRFFTGLTIEQTAATLGVDERTVTRSWTAARTWLQRELGAGPEKEPAPDAG